MIASFAVQVSEDVHGLAGTRPFAPPRAKDDENGRAAPHDAGCA